MLSQNTLLMPLNSLNSCRPSITREIAGFLALHAHFLQQIYKSYRDCCSALKISEMGSLCLQMFLFVLREMREKNINFAQFLPGQEKGEVPLVAIRKSHGFI